jgi:hypothetical protein
VQPVLKVLFIYLPQFFGTWLLRVRKMNRKWRHSAVTLAMLDTKIANLRTEYGIKVSPTYHSMDGAT